MRALLWPRPVFAEVEAEDLAGGEATAGLQQPLAVQTKLEADMLGPAPAAKDSRGSAARDAFIKIMSEDATMAATIRRLLCEELGQQPDSRPDSLLRDYVEKRVPVAEHRCSQWWRLGSRAEMAWLLTALPEPAYHALQKRRQQLRPFSRLAASSWMSANVAYVRELDYISSRMAASSLVEAPKGAKEEVREDDPEKPEKPPRRPRKGGKKGGDKGDKAEAQ